VGWKKYLVLVWLNQWSKLTICVKEMCEYHIQMVPLSCTWRTIKSRHGAKLCYVLKAWTFLVEKCNVCSSFIEYAHKCSIHFLRGKGDIWMKLDIWILKTIMVLQMKTCVAQALKTSAENRHLTISLERTALDISNTEKEINALFAWLINHQPI
jgi:hypothetical protein